MHQTISSNEKEEETVNNNNNNNDNSTTSSMIATTTIQAAAATETATDKQAENDENVTPNDNPSVALKICFYGGNARTFESTYLKSTTIADLEKDVKRLYNIDSEVETKLWINSVKEFPKDKTLEDYIKLISLDASKSISTASLYIITLEVINADGTWPSSRPRFGTVSTRSSRAQPGLCGLSNMGNTCFMNSALQCLSNTPPLTQYILTDKFVDDINTNNPLGMRGEIARTYADLIKVMWSGNNTSFLPREFKCAVSRFAPQFNGFAQQDCQELMAFLLDGLHEDLNRIREKPYIEIKNDNERRPDEVLADESWSNYKRRNDSIVVDTFHAMLKSTLVCPGCQLVSVTFDPFCYLSLPLPVKREKQINLTFIPAPSRIDLETLDETLLKHLDQEEIETIKQYGGSITSFNSIAEQYGFYYNLKNRPKGCKLQVPRSGPVGEICEIVARVINDLNEEKNCESDKVLPEKLVVAELSTDGRISKVYESNEHYNQLSDDVVVVERANNFVVPLYIKERKDENCSNSSVIGKPLFLHVPDLKYETLYKSVIASLSNLTGELAKSGEAFCSTIKGEDMVSDHEMTYENWYKLSDPKEDKIVGKESVDMECDIDAEMSAGDADQNNSDPSAIDSEIQSVAADVTNGDAVKSSCYNGISEEVNGETKTNGTSSVHKMIAEDSKSHSLPNNAFELFLVNSSGYLSVEKLGSNKKECVYSSKLYLGAAFNSSTIFLPQFKHINRTKYADSVEFFVPKVTLKPTLQLKDCITQFANVERLGADDPWYCPKCKKHQQATKKFDIWSLPKVLIIHLKRFSYSRSWRDKIDTLVEFPVDNLDMSKYVLNPSQKEKSKLIYNLIGVANHFGGLGGGHYTAYAKNASLDAWYSFDDALVTPASSSNVVTRSAYVLFYQLQED